MRLSTVIPAAPSAAIPGTGLPGGVILLLAGCLFIGGCASLAPPAGRPGQGAPAAQAVRQYHDRIDLGGRLSLRYEKNGQEQALDGKFTWLQDAGLTHVTLLTPFGQTLASIDVAPGAATLTQSGQPPRSEANVDALTATALGWPLPIAGLRDWLQGFASNQQGLPYVANAEAAADKAYVKTADGWLIQYPVWEPAATDGGARPKRIDLQRTTSQAGNVTLRIVLDQWQPR